MATHVQEQSLHPGSSLAGPFAQLVRSDGLGVPLLLLGRLSNAPLVLVDAVDNLGVIVSDAQHFRGFVA